MTAPAQNRDADVAYRATRSTLPCVAADWAGDTDGLLTTILVVFGLALVAIALSYLL